jgi:hypothetical protein
MKKILLLVVALAAILLWVPVDGVTQELRNPLRSMTVMDHAVTVTWDNQISSSEQRFTQEAERAIELGLLRTGITLDEDAGSYLSCSINLLAVNNGNTVIYSHDVSFREPVMPWNSAAYLLMNPNAVDQAEMPDILEANYQFADVWGTSSVGTVGINNLSGTSFGEWCAETFELEWRRANN